MLPLLPPTSDIPHLLLIARHRECFWSWREVSPPLLAMGTETDRQSNSNLAILLAPLLSHSANSTALLYMINAHSSHNCSYPAAISAQLNTAEYSSSSYPVIEAGSSHPGAQPIPNQPWWCVYRPLFDPLVCRSDQATLIQKDDRYCLAIIPASIHAFTVNVHHVQWGRREQLILLK